VIDESALTGEALPVVYRRGQPVRSGTLSTGASRIRVTHRAADSAYAAVVRLARDAETQRAPFVRMADRYAALFLPLTAIVAAAAWAVSGDPVRALTVFVVATPCPLILAAPIALLSGVSRAARIGVVVKGGGVIERLGNTRTVILDKTGTITLGTPELARIGCVDGLGEAEVLRLAASVDLASVHPFATALVREAQDRGLALQFPLEVAERPGQGVEGTIAGRRVAVGSGTFLREAGYTGTEAIDGELAPGAARALVGVDGRLAAWFEPQTPPREGSLELAARLRRNGVVQVAMLTGDRRAVAELFRALLGIDRIYAEQTPEEKLAVVRAIKADTGASSGRDGRRRHQRRARARTRRRRDRDGVVRGDGID
jgi:P-type E1-E2 ATPase